MKLSKLYSILMVGMVLISFPSCNGVFEDIYDEPVEKGPEGEYGFKNVDLSKNSGTIYVDASSYTRWIYLNFHDRTIDSLEIGSANPEPEKWDVALHRYDTKIQEGGAMETEFKDLSSFLNSGKMPAGEFIADVPGKVTIDMSGMMEGNIKTVDSPVNLELAKWLDVDTSTMPPAYTLSNKIYLVKLKDGSVAALQLKDFRNKKFDKGFMTIDYIYPVKF